MLLSYLQGYAGMVKVVNEDMCTIELQGVTRNITVHRDKLALVEQLQWPLSSFGIAVVRHAQNRFDFCCFVSESRKPEVGMQLGILFRLGCRLLGPSRRAGTAAAPPARLCTIRQVFVWAVFLAFSVFSIASLDA